MQGEQRRSRLVRSKSAKDVLLCVGDRNAFEGLESAHVLHKNRSLRLQQKQKGFKI